MPFEARHGRRFRVRIVEVGKAKLVDVELIQDVVDKVKLVRDRVVTTQSEKKLYSNKKHRHKEFTVGEHVFLQV
jgi:hypothetical protein